MAFKGLHENRLTCDIHIIVQGDHGVAPLVWVREVWELMPLLCREKETVYLVFVEQKTTREALIRGRRGQGIRHTYVHFSNTILIQRCLYIYVV